MAKYFDGFRLDNLHGTQLNVAQTMIKEARKAKQEIIVFAELFTTTEQEKVVFVRTSGINSMLFELRRDVSGKRFLNLFYESMGNHGKYTGSISPHFERPYGTRVKYCKRKKPIPLIYDQTHDNRTYEE
jgi:glycogen debranching enzyme